MIGTAIAVTGAYVVGRNVSRINRLRAEDSNVRKAGRKAKSAAKKAKAKAKSAGRKVRDKFS